MNDPVNHPAHYNTGQIEVVDAILDWKLGFNLGNVVKYVARADFKENALVDLEKAAWYLKLEIERRKRHLGGSRKTQLDKTDPGNYPIESPKLGSFKDLPPYSGI